MVFTLSIHHLFKFPVEAVLKSYINKHDSTDSIKKVEIISSSQEERSSLHFYAVLVYLALTFHIDGMTCVKRRITMDNYFPNFFRRLEILKRNSVTLEDEIWSQNNEKRHWIRIKDNTWEHAVIAHLVYLSQYDKNPEWSLWEKDTVVDLSSFGVFGIILELYLRRHLQNELKNELSILKKVMTIND